MQPAHPVFSFPNRIVASDFDGWIQERNAYGFMKWDERYTPLLESHAPWETEQKGALQLPDGVPGAYRIVANLISLGKAQQ